MVEHDPEWERRAKCQDTGVPEVWYPERNRDLYRFVAAQAKAVCWGYDGRPVCPVREQCLHDALSRDERFGIWGGMSHRERNALLRKRARLALAEAG